MCRFVILAAVWTAFVSDVAAQNRSDTLSAEQSPPIEDNAPQAGAANCPVELSAATPAPASQSSRAARAAMSIPKGERLAASPNRDLPWYRSPYAALVGVIGLIITASALLRRFVPAAKPIATNAVRVVGRAPISSKQSVIVLQIGRRLLLVASSAESLRTLAEITDPEEVALLVGKGSSSGGTANKAFAQRLAGEFGKYAQVMEGIETEAGGGDGAGDDTLRETQGQLRRLAGRLRALQSGRNGDGVEG